MKLAYRRQPRSTFRVGQAGHERRHADALAVDAPPVDLA